MKGSRKGSRTLRGLAVLLAVVALASVLLFAGNQSRWLQPPAVRPFLLSHRGVHQTFDVRGLRSDTCTAAQIHAPTHALIENTLPSMRAAFDAGADMVEFDVHPTNDGAFAVFHDWTLECRTEGRGVVRDHTLAQLQVLDVGYGYTSDGGKTYPLRGKGIGLMPSLSQVLGEFPTRRFLIHVKSRDAEEGRLLAGRLAALDAVQRSRLVVYGSDEPVSALKQALPDIRVAPRSALVQCLLRYAALGWSSYVPEACRSGLMLVPVNVAPWLWGWPHRLQRRLETAGTRLVVVGPYAGGDFSSGIDNTETLAELPVDYRGGLWTNRIERIGPAVRSRVPD
ncbi:glycerophosphoryl diester phosphodiesterase [Variovorax paradoxus]|uniref:glycerophosphodiester phosphodiesterase family protein n=1 Tax=Variovorax paradoxus TaxID=34073 RepID=UPI003391171C